MTIHELAKKPQNATDKQDKNHTFNGRNYLHHYERHFESIRSKPVKLLEIGVKDGCSLRLWRDYFPNGLIHGLDINPEAGSARGVRITVHIGNQSSTATLKQIASNGPWDIIIDDGSHYVPHILQGFEALWPAVKNGGWYVWEDMSLSYEGVDLNWPGMKFNNEMGDNANDRRLINQKLEQLVQPMDFHKGEIASVHLYPKVYFLEKVA